jgi:hypothetical protein
MISKNFLIKAIRRGYKQVRQKALCADSSLSLDKAKRFEKEILFI